MVLTNDRTFLPCEAIREVSKVIFVEDEPPLLAFLVKLTNSQPDFNIVGQAGDCVLGFEIFRRLKPDIVVTNIGMPRMNGFTLTHKILEIDPKAKVMILSGKGLPEEIQFGMQADARLYLTKPISEEDFLMGLRTVASGKNPRLDPWG